MSVPVIKFMFRNEWKVLSDAVQLHPLHEVKEFSNATDLMAFLDGSFAGMIVTSLQDKNDLIQLATVVKLSKKLAPNTLIKVMVVNSSGDKQIEKAVEKLGIMDIVDERIQTKALRFKIDFIMKSINVHVKKMGSTIQASAAVKTTEQNKLAEKALNELPPIWSNQLDHEADIWLLKTETDCKKVIGRWLIKFMGPSPYVAQWVESNNQGIYKFEFKTENNDFFPGKGAWFFRGEQKPEFIWSDNLWSFTGTGFELFFKEGNDLVSRLRLKDKQLTICKNSDAAKFKEKDIIESFDKDLLFKKEQDKKVESDTVDKDIEKYKNLEGKGKTDTIDGGPLSGKSQTDAIDGGPLSGKGKTSHLNNRPMSMDLEEGENDLSSDQLSMEANAAKRSSFWKGKNAYNKEGTADPGHAADQKINSGSGLGMEHKSNHEKFYKNHNEAEQFDAKDIGHGIKKDGVSGNLKGKTSTDEIEGHLSSPDEEKRAAKAKADAELSTKNPKGDIPRHGSPNGNGKQSQSAPADDIESHMARMDIVISSKTGAKPHQDNSNKPANEISNNLTQPRLEKVIDINSRKKKSEAFVDIDPEEDLATAMESAEVTALLIQDLVKVECVLDDFFDKTIIFRAKKAGIESGKNLILNLKFNYLSKDTFLKCVGMVTVIDVDEAETQYVNVEISQENVEAFNSFMKLYGARQSNINLFLKTVKGN